jgi:uncharacterized protein (DUF2267 family)
MQKTTLSLFEGSLEVTDRWLSDLMKELGWTDRQKAFAALRAVLHAVRNVVPVNECAQLSAQLPLLLKGVYWEGWDPTPSAPGHRSQEAFLAAVRKPFRQDDKVDPARIVRAVFTVMDTHVTAGEMEDIRGTLPEKIRTLAPALHAALSS